MIEKSLSCFLYGPGNAKFEERPIPKLEDPHDVLIRIAYTGVCGSDVHFWVHGGIGTKVGTEPLIMGHEASGTVYSIGSAVTTVSPGDRVAIEPGFPCRRCERCKEGKYNHCPSMTFAASPPDSHGTLTKYFRLPEDFCYRIPDSMSLQEAVLVEPLAVAVHMARLVDARFGQSVVVFGAGTVGLLCAAVAKAFGARKVISVDIAEKRLRFAKEFAATGTFVPGKATAEQNAERLIREQDLGVGADVVLEASGAASAVETGILILRPGGSYVQGGLGAKKIEFPIFQMCEKELNVKGCFRYSAGDYHLALSLLESGKLSVKELITEVVDFEQATEAWEITRRGEGIKTLIRGVQDRSSML
ncbi:MAG: hypothetical protein M1827_005114 [Pycnora praestabilis]|nr:MAG: hypothetical protein M1827_005114 [Pycnora praestabilis]